MNGENDLNYQTFTKEIIGYTPRWIVRWGIIMIFISFGLLGVVLAMIRFPIRITLPATLEYDRKPAPVRTSGNSILLQLSKNRISQVSKGDRLATMENAHDGNSYVIEAPVSGKFYLSDNWKDSSFISSGEILGFIIPQPNERLIKLKISWQKYPKLQEGQKVRVNVRFPNGQNLNLEGYIDFVSAQLGSNSFVNLKFAPEATRNLSSDSSVDALDKLNCSVDLTVDTTSYLNYLFHRK